MTAGALVVTWGWRGRLGAWVVRFAMADVEARAASVWVVRFAMAVIAGNKLTPPDHRQYNSFQRSAVILWA
jgi:hypothetical protein